MVNDLRTVHFVLGLMGLISLLAVVDIFCLSWVGKAIPKEISDALTFCVGTLAGALWNTATRKPADPTA